MHGYKSKITNLRAAVPQSQWKSCPLHNKKAYYLESTAMFFIPRQYSWDFRHEYERRK